MTNADSILQTYLDKVAEAVMGNDWDSYSASVVLPFHLVTHNANITLTTEADLRGSFDGFRQTLLLQRVTDYIRLVQSGHQIDADLISGSYVTHLLSGGQRLLDPFTSQITLRRVDDTWRAASITNSISSSRWPLLLHSAAPASPFLPTSSTKGPTQ